ncbi:lytic transglycosylase domain-containing protein [Streptomyces mexicanus]|uniref:lytic transglycosylase domain-containing protein n=1 Tax=Streptomyces mexicanus TaxID=178566 RepID=UPI001359166F|nr:lytic transglycosylase domain-containing protein [Streptomyces mexicanus]
MAAYFGRRLYKGAATTAVAAAAVAALTASQAPGNTVDGQDRPTAAGATPAPDDDGAATGNSPYYTDLPPLNSPSPAPSATAGPSTPQTPAEAGIPATVLDAYKKAAAELRADKPGCNLPWELLAAIGKVESGQARGGRVNAEGTTLTPILGPVLNGSGFAHISDTDHGAYDGDATYDRAIGPMQFIPSTWAWAGRDGNGDGKKDPNNVYDAALAAGHYLCRNGWDLSNAADLDKAILSYNNSRDYLNTVRSWLEYYRRGTHTIPDGTGTLPSGRSDDTTRTHRASSSPAASTPGASPRPGHSGKDGDGSGGGSGRPSDSGTTPGTGNGGGGPSRTPSPTPSRSASQPTMPPTPTDRVDHLADAHTGKLTAMAGDTFAQRIHTRAETEAGAAVAKVRIRFTIIGDTDTTFAGGEKVATVLTDATGVAVAPALRAGEQTGGFTVRALVVGRTVSGLEYRATVTERAADTLTRTSDTPLTCTPGGAFADRVEVRATYEGAAADGGAPTATLVTSADDPAENDKGPYFKDADGKPVRTLKDLRTDDKGLLTLPKLYADDTTGTFLLRITTTGGATLTVELKVAPADTSAEPSPGSSAEPSPSTSADASPSA